MSVGAGTETRSETGESWGIVGPTAVVAAAEKVQREGCPPPGSTPGDTPEAFNQRAPVKIIIEGRPEHLHALRAACEHYFRIALGQFREVAVEHLKRLDSKGGTWWDVATEVERMLKPILTPDLPSAGSSYGVGNRNLSRQSHLCYELWKLFGGGTDGPPLNYSGVELPRVTIEGDA